MRYYCAAAVLVACLGIPAHAQLNTEQRVHDFTNLASLYAKRYAPYEWKKQLSGYDALNLAPWLDRVRTAKDDLQFFEICSEYVAMLDDRHSYFVTPSSFIASLGFTADLYDGKALIESINRVQLPLTAFPVNVGDELVSVDGKTVEQLIAEFSVLRRGGTPVHTRRAAVDLITFRPQSAIPRVVELGPTARVQIRPPGGELQDFTLLWIKSGLPLTKVGPVPFPALRFGASLQQATESQPEPLPYYLQLMEEMRNWRVPNDDPLLQGVSFTDDLELVPRRYILGWGSRAPTFRMPANFVQRLGQSATDFHFSGTYESGGLRLGYLRIPNFAPPSTVLAVRELDTEISYLQNNTDGLVVDVTRNTGGGCYMLDAAAHLIPSNFFFFGEELRVTFDRVSAVDRALQSARTFRAPDWIVKYYETVLAAVQEAYQQSRGRTSSLPACSQLNQPYPPVFENVPAPVVYSKPLIVLIDEFSTSAGDIFPAMLQDNRRGPLVGTRTNGAGGSISGWPTGIFSEASSTNTNSLVMRRAPVTIEGFPVTSYIENVGAHADIRLDRMTRDNLMTWRPAVCRRVHANPDRSNPRHPPIGRPLRLWPSFSC